MIDHPSRQRRATRRRNERVSGVVGGLVIVTIGTIFWLDHLGRLDAHDYFRWWPLILVAYGISHLIQRSWIGATLLLVLGLAFLPPLAFAPHFAFSTILGLFPLLISAAGVTLILQALRPTLKDVPHASAFRAISFMGGSSRTVNAQPFTGGDAIAVMGGCEIRVASSGVAAGATIDVLAFWGGVEIQVPRGWRIESHVAPIVGAYSDRTAETSIADAPVVVIRGSAIMGGIEVRNPKEEIA